MKWTVELPLPPVDCAQNAHVHWTRKRAAVAQYRQECWLAYRTAQLPTIAIFPVTLHLDFYLARPDRRQFPNGDGRYRPRDEDNARASFKAGQDALVDARILPNDSRRYMRSGETRLHTTKREHNGRACIVLTLEIPNAQN